MRLYINEKTLRLAQRHVSQTKSSFECFLVGSISVDSGKYYLKKVSHTLNTEPLIPELLNWDSVECMFAVHVSSD